MKSKKRDKNSGICCNGNRWGKNWGKDLCNPRPIEKKKA